MSATFPAKKSKNKSHSLKREHETSSDEVESSTIPTAPTVPTLRFEDEDTDEEEEAKEKEGEEDEKDGEDEALEELKKDKVSYLFVIVTFLLQQ